MCAGVVARSRRARMRSIVSTCWAFSPRRSASSYKRLKPRCRKRPIIRIVYSDNCHLSIGDQEQKTFPIPDPCILISDPCYPILGPKKTTQLEQPKENL